jgi:TonB family protein
VLKAKAAVQALEDKAREAESKQRAAALLAEGAKALDSGDVAKAEQALAEARGLDKGNPQVTALEARIKAAKDKPAGRVDVGEPLLTGVGYAPLQFSSRGVPEFPAAALASKTQGKVMVSVQVAPDGSVKDAKLVKSAPAETGFNEAALKAAKAWKFQPPTKDGGGEATEDTMWSVVVKFEP